jgi:hypothetical protein
MSFYVRGIATVQGGSVVFAPSTSE